MSFFGGPFGEGIARGFDLFGARNRANVYRGKDGLVADAKALSSDWEVVGRDVADGVKLTVREHDQRAAERK